MEFNLELMKIPKEFGAGEPTGSISIWQQKLTTQHGGYCDRNVIQVLNPETELLNLGKRRGKVVLPREGHT